MDVRVPDGFVMASYNEEAETRFESTAVNGYRLTVSRRGTDAGVLQPWPYQRALSRDPSEYTYKESKFSNRSFQPQAQLSI